MDKKVALSFVTAGAVLLVAVGASAVSDNKNTFVLEAAVPTQTTRRIWAVDNTNTGWFVGDHLYLHLNSTNSEVEMTRVLEDFRGGLFYADITSDETGILFRNNIMSWLPVYNQTDDVTIKDGGLLHTDEVFYINQNSGDGKCPVSEGTAEMSNAQLAETLRYFSTCAQDYCYGCLAYPFVKALYDADNDTATDKDTTIVSPKGESTKAGYQEIAGTTIGDKVTLMGQEYAKAIA